MPGVDADTTLPPDGLQQVQGNPNPAARFLLYLAGQPQIAPAKAGRPARAASNPARRSAALDADLADGAAHGVPQFSQLGEQGVPALLQFPAIALLQHRLDVCPILPLQSHPNLLGLAFSFPIAYSGC